MTVRLSVTVVVVWLSALAAIASAQSLPLTANRRDEPTNVSTTENGVVETSANGANDTAGVPSSKARSRQTPLFLRVYGGFGSTADVTGVGVAGGVAARPFRQQNMEVEGDLSLFHYANTVVGTGATANVVEFTGDFLYNFPLARQKLVPFAGGGLVVGHGSTDVDHFFRDSLSLGPGTAAGVDLVGGVELPISGQTAFRGELHVHGYAGGSAVIVWGGLSFKLD